VYHRAKKKCLKSHYVPSQRGPWTAGHVYGDSMFHIHDTRLYGVTAQSLHNASQHTAVKTRKISVLCFTRALT